MIYHEDTASVLPLHLYLPIVMFVLAILMISRLRFPKAVVRKSMLINIFQFANIAGIVVCGVLRIFPEYLFSIGVFLLVAGIIAGRITRDEQG
jgi:phosphatidylserine synthase